MNKISFGYQSFGTIFGTVRDYNTLGDDIGVKNITGYGIFFVVRDRWEQLDSQIIISKKIDSGISITNGSYGKFSITFSSSDLDIPFAEYVYDTFLNPSGTFWGGTHNLKSIGSGIFEITRGLEYGTKS